MTTAEPDRGLQAVRTALSWRRTALTATTVAALTGSHAVRGGTVQTAATLTLSMTAVVVVLVTAAHRSTVLSHRTPALPTWVMTLTSLSVSTAAVCTAAQMVTCAQC